MRLGVVAKFVTKACKVYLCYTWIKEESTTKNVSIKGVSKVLNSSTDVARDGLISFVCMLLGVFTHRWEVVGGMCSILFEYDGRLLSYSRRYRSHVCESN